LPVVSRLTGRRFALRVSRCQYEYTAIEQQAQEVGADFLFEVGAEAVGSSGLDQSSLTFIRSARLVGVGSLLELGAGEGVLGGGPDG
jgi:hypothetical protein